MPENTIGKIILEAGARGQAQTGGGAPTLTGLIGGDSGAESAGRKIQNETRNWQQKMLGGIQGQPKWWTRMFKTMGIQVGLSGILKQSQIFTGTIGSIFQIFGAFVDVLLAPFVPLFIPAIRWLARKLPGVAKWAQGFAEWVKRFSTKVGEFFKDPFSKLGDALKTAWNWIETKLKNLWAWVRSFIPGWLGGTKGQDKGPDGGKNGPKGKNGPLPSQLYGVDVPGASAANAAHAKAQEYVSEEMDTTEKIIASAVAIKAGSMALRGGLHQLTPSGVMQAGRAGLKGATRGTGAVVTNLWDRIRGGDGRIPRKPPAPTAATGYGLFDDASDLGHRGTRGGPRAATKFVAHGMDEIPAQVKRLGPLGDFIEAGARKFTGAMDEVGRALTPVVDAIQNSRIMNVNVNPARNRFTTPIYAAAKVLDNSSNFALKNAFKIGKAMVSNPFIRKAAGAAAGPAGVYAMAGYDFAEGMYDMKNIATSDNPWWGGFNVGGWSQGMSQPFTNPGSLSSWMGGPDQNLIQGKGFDLINRGVGTAAIPIGAAFGGPAGAFAGSMVSESTALSTGTGFFGNENSRYGQSDLFLDIIAPSIADGFRGALNNIPGI